MAEPLPEPALPGPWLAQIAQDQSRALTRARRRAGWLLFLILSSATYLGWIHLSLGKIDAQLLSRRIGEHLLERLPTWQRALRAWAIQEAPNLTAGARDALLQAPACLRYKIEWLVAAQTQGTLERMESELNAHLSRQLHLQLSEMRETSREARSNEECLERFLNTYRQQFREHLREEYLGRGYEEFAAGLTDLETQLLRLRTGKNLTAKEELEREIILASVALMEKLGLNAEQTIEAGFEEAIK